MADQPPSPWLVLREAAARVPCGPRLLLREIRAGRLRAARIGGRKEVRIHQGWLDEWLMQASEPVEIGGRR